MGIVLDSTVLIAAERAGHTPRQAIAELLQNQGDLVAVLSVITAMELTQGIERANTLERRLRRQRFLNELLAEIAVEPVTIPIALRAGQIDASLQSKGLRVALGDLLIGSTAIELGHDVATHNARHFEMIPNLRIKKL